MHDLIIYLKWWLELTLRIRCFSKSGLHNSVKLTQCSPELDLSLFCNTLGEWTWPFFVKYALKNRELYAANPRNGEARASVWQSQCLTIQRQEPPIVSYKYTKTIGPSVFNFKKVTESINLSSDDCTTCKCSSSAFLYRPLGHACGHRWPQHHNPQ